MDARAAGNRVPYLLCMRSSASLLALLAALDHFANVVVRKLPEKFKKQPV
jgi:hypothetical protein